MPRPTGHGRRNEPSIQPQLVPAVLENQGQIDGVCQEARTEGRFAFDTEFVMEDRYEPEVCLVQVATARQIALIDPFREVDLRPIWELVGDPAVETVVHAGQEDLALCVQHTGRLPRNIFDVQVAAGLAGYDYPLSLQKLVQATLRHRLHKGKTLTDWRRRPLTDSQYRYAAEDVAYLLAVREKLAQRLAKRGRTDWATEEFRRFEDLSLYGRVEEEKIRRLKGTATMGGKELAIVRALLHWREGLAEELNRPPRVVLKDHLLVEIAKLGLTGRDDIRELRGMNLSDRHVRMLGQVVAEAAALPPEHWPQPAPREIEGPREEAVTGLLTAVLRSHCLDEGLAYGLVATKQMIRDVVRTRESPSRPGRPAPAGTAGPRRAGPAGEAESTGDSQDDQHSRFKTGRARRHSRVEAGEAHSEAGKPKELLTGWRAQAVGWLVEQILTGERRIHVARLGDELTIRTDDPAVDARP